jgi:hypothetical protein
MPWVRIVSRYMRRANCNKMTQYDKTDVPNMVIDRSTGAVINNNLGDYYRLKKAREEKRKATELIDRVSQLEQEVKDLRNMIKMLSKGTSL